MDDQIILSGYDKMQAMFDMPRMASVSISIAHETFTDHTRLLEAVRRFAATQGWLCFQSAVRCFGNNEDFSLVGDGHLLNAELVNAASDSLHIRQVGATWVASIYQAVTNAGDTYLADSVMQLSADQRLGKLEYQRLWKEVPGMGLAPVMARFLGFTANVEEVSK